MFIRILDFKNTWVEARKTGLKTRILCDHLARKQAYPEDSPPDPP
jgi:hypothetical protein